MDLHIQSHEGGIYLAFLEDKESSVTVLTKENSPLRFKGLAEAKQHFSSRSFDNVWLSHSHVCDEVIGADTGYEQPKIELHW